jgi:hypothetical protein
MSLTSATLHTVVAVGARDTEDGIEHRGNFRVVTKDVGATIGVGVYSIETLVHSFYAHTRYADRACEITRDLIFETIDEIRRDRGARFIFESFAERFAAIAYERGHDPLDPQELAPEDPS